MFSRALVGLVLCAAVASAGLVVYSDALASGWVDYSFPAGAANFASTTFVHAGTKSIATTAAQWQALSVHSSTVLSTASYSAVRYGTCDTLNWCAL